MSNLRRANKKVVSPFHRRILAVVRGIRVGQVLTYADVAKRAGYPKAYRAVGSVLKHNFNPIIPCHRVIRADGSVGQYNRGGSINKQRLLRAEQAYYRGRAI